MKDIVLEWANAAGTEVLTSPQAPNQLILKQPKGTPFPVRVAFLEDRNMVWFQVEFSDTIPEPRYFETSRAMAMLNATIFIGSWNLLTQTGKLYFKVAVPTKGAAFTAESVDFILQLLLGTVQTTAPKLLAVALRDQPAQSVRQ
jgi:hypothetical protein